MFYGEETGNQKYQACVLEVRYGRAGGKKQDYTSIIVKAMIGHYDREVETRLTNEELLAKIQESVRKEAEGIKKSIPQTPYPMMSPYMPVTSPGM